MSEKRYLVELSEAERQELATVIKARRMSAEKRVRAQVLLMIDQGPEGAKWSDERAAEAYGRSVASVATLRKRLVERGFRGALERRAQVRPSRIRKLDEEGERELVALAQGDPPKGRARWTLHLLGRRLVTLEVVDSISHETVRKVLKKTIFSHTFKPHG